MSLTTLVSNVNAALVQSRTDTMNLQQALVNQGTLAAAKTKLREATVLCSSANVQEATDRVHIRQQAQSVVDGFEQRKRSIKADLAKAQKAERSLCKVKYALTGETVAPPARAHSPTRKCSVCQGTDHNRATCPAVARSMTAYVTGPTKRKAEVLEALEAEPKQIAEASVVKVGGSKQPRALTEYNRYMKSAIKKYKKQNPNAEHQTAFTACAANWTKAKLAQKRYYA